jgi:GAF domain-containing protein
MANLQGAQAVALLAIGSAGSVRGQYLGCLSVGHVQPGLYTQEHLRRAELLAIAAAAAIQNARLYETARIYGEELEKRIGDLKRAEAALAQSEDSRKRSEEKFQKVFRSSPIPFSITTLKEGRFLDVNAAFEMQIRIFPRRSAWSHRP